MVRVSSNNSFVIDDDEENTKGKDNLQWKVGAASGSFSEIVIDESVSYFQSADKHGLQILQKKETMTTRSIIPATKLEKMAFLQAFVSSSCKSEFLHSQRLNFNKFFWNYLDNVIEKSLPSCYMYLFLGSYAPDHHLFLSKMVPLCHGLNLIWIFASVIQLILFCRMNTLFLDYAICGILYQNPWNRCDIPSLFLPTENVTIYCYELDDFLKRIDNKTINSNELFHYDASTKEAFQLAQSLYNINRVYFLIEENYFGLRIISIYAIFYWAISSLLCSQIFKRTIWKVLGVLHCSLAIVYACTIVYIDVITTSEPDVDTAFNMPTQFVTKLVEVDLDSMAESMTTPPVLHILTSRSKEEVKLSLDTAIIVTSNALFYIFKGIVTYKMRKLSVILTKVKQDFIITLPAVLYFWPLFFSTLYLGNLYSVCFWSLSFVVEFLTFTLTHQCLIEVVVCEWQFLKRWQAAVIFFAAICLYEYLPTSGYLDKYLGMVTPFSINLVTLIEVTIICIMYPLSRLIEDITFYYGVAPSTFSVVLLQIMFLHYFLKSFYMIKTFMFTTKVIETWVSIASYVLITALITGVFSKAYTDVYKKKKGWNLMLRPYKYFGPPDFTSRWLRKMFSSTTYIASQAPRELSRNLILKAEPKVYRLDLRYNIEMRRRSTQPQIDYQLDKNETK